MYMEISKQIQYSLKELHSLVYHNILVTMESKSVLSTALQHHR